MSNRPLKTLLENAHLEAANLAHHYVGVEHLFSAMIRETAHEHTLTARALHKLHLPPQYVLEKFQYCTFPNDEKRQWEGHQQRQRQEPDRAPLCAHLLVAAARTAASRANARGMVGPPHQIRLGANVSRRVPCR